ncbi:MAG: collagen-like protein [Gaiellaceae bacterium MAG52_C11]|nr:collagen-like protein [Candidatus Gaiellasilicea maunaloa]
MKIRIPTPATAIASLALLFSLTGTAVAGALITGAQIKNNTVSTLDLANNSARSIDVKDNSLTSVDIHNGALKAIDFAPGQLTAGAVGPAGPAGPQGPSGAQGAQGTSGLEIVSAVSATSSDVNRQVEISCPAGKKLVGGGAHIWDAATDVALDESYPANPTTWRATAWEVNATGASWHLQAYAICANVAP